MCYWERCCRCTGWHCSSVVHSGAAWYTMVLFLRRLWNRLYLLHSGAVCYTVSLFLCRLYVVRAHGAVWEQADWSIVVPCVTLWLIMFAQWCRLWHWGLFRHSGAACYTMFSLHIDYGSLQCIVYTVVPFVALGLVVNPSLLTEVSCTFTCSNVWCRLLHTWHACVEQICDWLYGSKQL